MSRQAPCLTCIFLLFICLPIAPLASQEGELSKETVPATVKQAKCVYDLRALEKQAQAVLEKVKPAVVFVSYGPYAGSGVIVSADGIVLTAGVVSGEPKSAVSITLANGKKCKAISLGRQESMDLGMIKILDDGPFPFLEMGKSGNLESGAWCIALGHPRGYHADRGVVVRMGCVLSSQETFIQSDCALVGGDNGGPLVDMDGKVIGIHSRIGLKMTQNYHVPIDAFRKSWDRLLAGMDWGKFGPRALAESAGGTVVLKKSDELTTDDPRGAGGKGPPYKISELLMVPGFAYTIDMQSKTLDSFLILEDADGKKLAENDDGGDEQNARIVFRPSQAGIYRIKATVFEQGETGGFVLTVRRAEISAEKLPGEGDVRVLDEIDMSPSAVKTMIRRCETYYDIKPFVNVHIFDVAGRPSAGKVTSFRWKYGQETPTTDEQGQVRLPVTQEMMASLVVEVPEGFKALIRLTDADGNPLRNLTE